MNKKGLGVLVFLGVIVAGAALITGCGGESREAPAPTPTPAPTPAPQLSEQPNEAVFKEYFTDIGLGKVPPGENFPEGLQKNITAFTPSDRIYVHGIVTKEVLPSFAVYDTVAKEFASPKQALPRALTKGNFAAGGSTLPVGKYECKVYVGDVLVAVLPFEVHE